MGLPGEHGPPISICLFLQFELKVVAGERGFHVFLLGMRADGRTEDLLPITETPAMPTAREAEELGLVVLWNELARRTDARGVPVSLLS